LQLFFIAKKGIATKNTQGTTKKGEQTRKTTQNTMHYKKKDVLRPLK